MTESRDWIHNTLSGRLRDSTPGEIEAAFKAATPGERAAAKTELELSMWWDQLQLRRVRGRMAHLREQYRRA